LSLRSEVLQVGFDRYRYQPILASIGINRYLFEYRHR